MEMHQLRRDHRSHHFQQSAEELGGSRCTACSTGAAISGDSLTIRSRFRTRALGSADQHASSAAKALSPSLTDTVLDYSQPNVQRQNDSNSHPMVACDASPILFADLPPPSKLSQLDPFKNAMLESGTPEMPLTRSYASYRRFPPRSTPEWARGDIASSHIG
jgi:hypothetical protein